MSLLGLVLGAIEDASHYQGSGDDYISPHSGDGWGPLCVDVRKPKPPLETSLDFYTDAEKSLAESEKRFQYADANYRKAMIKYIFSLGREKRRHREDTIFWETQKRFWEAAVQFEKGSMDYWLGRIGLDEGR